MANPDITLRYFNARGRAQFIRYYLRSRNIPFTDERIPISADFSEWQALRGDRNISGPFRKLPVLHYGEQVIAETAVIHSFLHTALGDAGELTEQQNQRQAMLASSCFSDLMLPMGTLIWADIMFEGIDLAGAVNRTLQRIRDHLGVMEQTLKDWQWLEHGGSRPLLLTDCLLWEELDIAQKLFGDQFSLADSPILASFYSTCPGRKAFNGLLDEHPCQITGRPGEADAITRIHQILSGT